MQLVEGAVVAERFRLERKLGEGGMGEVWTATHITLDVPCAVKFIHADAAANTVARARFEREAKAAAKLRSAHVVQILDYGVWGAVPYIAMEYLQGEDLRERLRRFGRLSPHDTFRVVSQIGKALSKAHALGIVHRDLKPENVFLVREDEAEIAKVLDFGVAKQTQSLESHTTTGTLLGTPYYMSPEQAQGIRAVDHRSDLWSLAVLTYRSLTGELPFQSQALGDLLIKICTRPIPVPSHVAPDLPSSFDQWWAHASQREPEHRFQSAKDLVHSLGVSLGLTMPPNLGFEASYGALPAVRNELSSTQDVSYPGGGRAATPFPSGPGVSGSGPAVLNQPAPAGSVGGMSTVAKPDNGSRMLVAAIIAACLFVGGGVAAFFMWPGLFSDEHTVAGVQSARTAEVPIPLMSATVSASVTVEPPPPPPSATASSGNETKSSTVSSSAAGGVRRTDVSATPSSTATAPAVRPTATTLGTTTARPTKTTTSSGYDPGF